MIEKNQILNTKLQSPNLPSDFIYRQKLIKYVNENIERPLTLVSAGAGFGKSTFVSSWVKEIAHNNAWVSLDNSDNDLRSFFQYLVIAIHRKEPEFGKNIKFLLNTPQLPPLKVLINNLINDLNNLSQFFILVLDDFHSINNRDIFNVLSSLIKFPPANFHLVLITRSDPPLPLAGLRAKNKMKDVRAVHLQLDQEEIKTFIEKYLQLENIDKITQILTDKLEGWIAGLRLAVLHLSFYESENEKLEKVLKETNFSEEYFLEEIINHLDKNTKEFLLKTSILEKFSAPLTEYILSTSKNGYSTGQIIRRFVKDNLFIINLDNQNIWYRYHHLFQSLLQKELKKKCTREMILSLHEKASEWYESHGLTDEAFYHMLQTDNPDKIAILIETHMFDLMNRDKWYVLDRWLRHLPSNYIKQSPALLIAQMWNLQNKTLLRELAELLPVFEELSGKMEIDKDLKTLYCFLKGVLLYWSPKIEHIKESYGLFSYVKDNLSDDKVGPKGVNVNYYAVAAHVNGKGKEAKHELDKIIFNEQLNPIYRTLPIGGNIFTEVSAGNLESALSYAKFLINLAIKYEDTFAKTWGFYFSAYIYFQQNKIEEAEEAFKKTLDNIYMLNIMGSVDCYAGMLLCQQRLNKINEFDETCRSLVEYVDDRNNPVFKSYAYSIKTRLALINDDLLTAEKNMNLVDMYFDSGNTSIWIEMPRLTYCRYLLALNEDDQTEEALQKLNTHITFAEQTRNTPLLINSLVLQAVAYKKKDKSAQAEKALTKALTKGKQGGWIRPFIDGGKEVYGLLTRLKSDNSLEKYRMLVLKELSDYIKAKNKKIESKKVSGKVNLSSAFFEELTNREMDIIILLAQRLSNKEIADKLFISLATVKRHTITIYQKLGVNGRRKAVQKAMELGILQHPGNNDSFYRL
jgi:LuxR family maltose regulon positive regulatory protein